MGNQVKAQAEAQGQNILKFLQKKYPARFQQANKKINQAQKVVNQNKNASVSSKLNQGKQAALDGCNLIQEQAFKDLCVQAVNASFKAAKKNIPSQIQNQSLNQVGIKTLHKAVAQA